MHIWACEYCIKTNLEKKNLNLAFKYERKAGCQMGEAGGEGSERKKIHAGGKDGERRREGLTP